MNIKKNNKNEKIKQLHSIQNGNYSFWLVYNGNKTENKLWKNGAHGQKANKENRRTSNTSLNFSWTEVMTRQAWKYAKERCIF